MKCSRCAAKCCAVYVLDNLDWTEISENMEISFEELTRKYPRRTQSLGPVKFCVFLDLNDMKCGIYKYRPIMCSDYKCIDWEPETRG